MQSYHHFTQSERICLAEMLKSGKSYREIGQAIGKNVSSVSRELKRNECKPKQYKASEAFVRYCIRRRRCVRTPLLLANAEINRYVQEKLAQFWPPAAIAGRWRQDSGDATRLSACTIYRAIDSGMLQGYSAKTHLRRRGIPYKPNRSRFNSIHPDHTIHELPQDAQLRQRLGDWEGDTISGCRSSGGLLSLIDRKSRLCLLRIVPDMSAATMARAMVAALEPLPRCSILLDNGSEFAKHRETALALNTTIYFADPHAPWQRATNENNNGRVRFFFPKGTDFKHMSPENVALVELLLNNRPMRCLDWLTPLEAFSSKCCT